MLVPKETGSLQDISYDFVNYMYGNQLDMKGKEQVFLAFRLLLKNGWTMGEMYLTLNEYFQKLLDDKRVITHPQNPNTDVIQAFVSKKPIQRNLLDPNKVYFHNQLRIYPAPAQVDFDYEKGTFSREEIEYYLEFRASYTIEELARYFTSRVGLCDEILGTDTNRILGGLNWLYSKFQDVELLLYMIDAAHNNVSIEGRGKLLNPSNLQDYYSEALAMRDFKRNECAMNGDVKVVPRKRVLSHRSWILDRQREEAVQ